MLVNGTVVDIKAYDSRKGKVINLYIRENNLSSIIFHTPLWGVDAETIGSLIKIGDNIVGNAYVSALNVKNRQITLSGFELIDVKRPTIVSEEIIFSERAETKKGDSHD